MKQLRYTLLTLLRGKVSNFTKIISLTLGLFVGILLFARVAFEMNYDTFYEKPEQLFLINGIYGLNGVAGEPTPYVYAPLAGALKENFPDMIVEGTSFRPWGTVNLFNGNHRLADKKVVMAGLNFFQTLEWKLLQGNPEDMVSPEVIFISESIAKQISGNYSELIGKTLSYNKTTPLTIRGVFEDMPENTEIGFDVVCSLSTLDKWSGSKRAGWGYDISYMGIVRLNNPEDAPEISSQILNMVKSKYRSYDADGFSEDYELQPLREYHSSHKNVKQMNIILSILAVALLLIAALNYVLISVSSLPVRAKAIGVHKCNGATSGNVLSMFLWETGIIIVVSLLVVVLLFLNFRSPIEDVMNASLGSIFAWDIMWVPLLVIAGLFVVAGLLPGYAFSSVQVSSIFRSYKEKKTSWKRPLLFVQFMGVPFIFGLLIVVLLQYNSMVNKEMAYNSKNVVSIEQYLRLEDGENFKDDLRRLPMVESVGAVGEQICYGYSGDGVVNESGKEMFQVRFTSCDYNYIPLMQIQLVEGRNFNAPGEVIVNETFVKQMHWTESPIGRQVMHRNSSYGTIVGVMKDFPVRSLYSGLEPVMYTSRREQQGCYTLRLKEPFDENLRALNAEMQNMYPQHDITFVSLEKTLRDLYQDTRRFRDSVMAASIAILLITLMGLLGYVNDEVRRRSKEIAIRKVNGAQAGDILRLISRDVAWTALPAVILGIIAAWLVGGKWIERFANKVDPGIPLFMLIGLVVLVLILVCVVIKSWRVANEDPVNSIKSE